MELKGNNDTIILDDNVKPIYRGGSSEIFRNEGLMVKVFQLVNNKSSSVISEENFDIIKKVKHRNFIDLVEKYHRVPKTSDMVEAYTYHEIEGETFNFLERDTEFCIEQLRELLSLFDILSELGIKIHDASEVNTIVLSDRIVLIDPDFYDYIGTSSNLKDFNRGQFKYLVLSYFFNYNRLVMPSLMFSYKDNDPVEYLAKELKLYKTPLDYIKNNRC